MKQITEKERTKKIAKMVTVAEGWFSRGFTVKQVQMGLWNSFGYTVMDFEDRVEIWAANKNYATVYAK